MITSWSINGVNFITPGRIKDTLGTLSYDLPDNLTATVNSTSNDVLIKLANYVNSMGLERIGSTLEVGVDGRQVAQNMCDVSLVCINSTPYSAGISSSPGTIRYNIFDREDLVFETNYVIKNISTLAKYILTEDKYGTVTEYTMLSSSASIVNNSVGILTVIADGNPYMSNSVITAVKFRITCTASSIYTKYSLAEVYASANRKSIPYTLYIDTLQIIRPPSIDLGYIDNIVPNSIVYFSGVPRFTAGTVVNFTVIVSNMVTEYYNHTHLLTSSSDCTAATSFLPNNDIILELYNAQSTTVGFALYAIILPNVYQSTGLIIAVNAHAPNGDITTYEVQYADSTISVDTKSELESNLRVPCGAGRYPTGVCTFASIGTFNSTLSIAASEELQLLGNRFVFPSLSYIDNYPTGPRYNSAYLTAPSYNSLRWLATHFIPVNGTVSGGTLTVTNILGNFTTAEVYIKLSDGSSWINALVPYDPSVTIGYNLSSTIGESSWVIEFINTPITTPAIFVRIGIRLGCSFERITATLIS